MNARASARLLLLCTGLFGCSRERESPEAVRAGIETSWISCERGTGEDACLEWGRAAMKAPPPDSLPSIEQDRVRFGRLSERFQGEEALAISGAGVVRLGGWLASHGEVLKAVECIDEGLARMVSGMRRYPTSKVLRIYYGTTLSYLPKDFDMGREGKDSLLAVKKRFPLSKDELEVVDDALRRIAD